MTAPTFFPPDVQRAMESTEADLARGYDNFDPDHAFVLLNELRRWEKAWRRGEARLVPQVEAKPNGEGGL